MSLERKTERMAEPTHPGQTGSSFLVGGGENGARMRQHDWSTTPLGAVEQWPQSLKTAVRIMLTSRQPMFVWWGDDLINLYNDPYISILGGKHPDALGQPASVVWREIWDQVAPRAESAMSRNEGTYDESLLLIMERNGYPEETYYTFSYSPVPNDEGGIGGIICANTDDTQRVISERQLSLLRELAAKTADARTLNEACRLSINCLASNPYDLPFALIYLVEPDHQLVLAGTSGVEPGNAIAPITASVEDTSIWPWAEILDLHEVRLISELSAQCSNLPLGAWPQPPHQAIAVPIRVGAQTDGQATTTTAGKAGIFIAGLNPFRLFDDSYRGFIDLAVAQIAASLTNAQAYQDERNRAEALAQIDRAKTLFFSNVSHEFRTPLSLMLGPLEDALNQIDTIADAKPTSLSELPLSTLKEQLQMAQRNSLRMLKLVNTLLDFSRIEAGRVQASYEPTDLPAFTAELASVFRSTIERAGMRLSIDCPPLPEPVFVDREMWEKIVLNLLSNAFKFTFEGEIRVSLRVDEQMSEQPDTASDRRAVTTHAILEIQDTGIGIPAAELPHLFERFHRVKGAQGRTFEGSGIGLSLVQELVHMHNGAVQVTSTVDEGSCFIVTIPMGSAHLPSDRICAAQTLVSTAVGATPYVEEALRWLPTDDSRNIWDDESKQSAAALSLTSAQAPSARILLADDNADMRDYVKRLLSTHYYVETVPDGVAALQIIRRNPPDLVLTDAMMPEMDGFQLLQALRNAPQTRDIPIILLSARAGEEARVEGITAGADDYLIKPFSARELLARIEATLKLAQMRQESALREQGLRIEAETAKIRLESVLSSINDQFIVLDRDWRYTFINQQVMTATGKSEHELMGHCIWDVYPDLIGTRFYNQLHAAIANQAETRIEMYYPPLQRWFENRIYPFKEGVTLVISDISDRKRSEAERKRAEASLQTSEERLRIAIAATGLGTWDFYPISGVLNWDERCKALFGLSPDAEVDYDIFLAGIHPNDRDRIHQCVQDALSPLGTGQYDCEYRTIGLEDGIERWIEARGQAFLDAEGTTARFIGTVLNITERKRADEALRDSEERFRLMADSAPVLIWMAGLDKGCIYFNQPWLDFTGRTFEQELGDGWAESLHPDDVQQCLATYARAFDARETFQIEYRLRRFDGNYRWIIDEGVPRFTSKGEFIGYIGSCIDIHDRKQAEAALKQSQTQLQTELHMMSRLQEFSTRLVATADLNSALNEVLNAAIEIHNTSMGNIQLLNPQTKTLHIVAHQGFNQEFLDYFSCVTDDYGACGRALHQRQRVIIEDVLTDPIFEPHRAIAISNGFRAVQSTPLFSRSGELLGILSTHFAQPHRPSDQELRIFDLYARQAVDLIERIRAEEALIESEQRFRNMADHAPVMIWVTDADGYCTYLSQSWYDFTGQTEATGLGFGWIDAVHPDDQPHSRAVFLQAKQSFQPFRLEYRLRRADGDYRWAIDAASPRIGADGQFKGYIGSVIDISERKAAEAERDRLLQRTQEARAEAERANRIKDEFLAVLSHELRSPLNPILGWVKLLQERQLDQDITQRALETIERNAKLQTQLVEDLLDVSRILSGKIALNPNPVDLVVIVRAAIDTVRLAAEAKQIEIHTQLSDRTSLVMGDPTRLQQIVWNLLSNAIKFTPAGGQVDVIVTLGETLPVLPHGVQTDYTSAHIIVSDTGKGISPEFLPYVFEYFRQEDGTTTRKFGGLGLGLAIVRHLTELHGGTVYADSLGEGNGATFVVSLPLRKPLAAQPQPASPKNDLVRLQGIKVLLVDDELDMQELARFVLEQQGLEVNVVSSADEALAALDSFKPDLLISDIGMPFVDGYMLMQQVRQRPANRGGTVPAIALTAYASEIDQQRSLAVGFQQHVAKPVEPNDLLSAIAALVQQPQD